MNMLLQYQRAWLNDTSRFKLGLWARQTGKDYTCAAEAVFDCVQNPKTHWLILACGERQARESLEKARDWSGALVNSASDHFNGGTTSGSPISFSRGAITPTETITRADNFGIRITRSSSTEIRFSNGSRITALPAKPSTVR
jgi:phage FluMu gp28-like protein